jgi:hypothetical protein
MPIIRDAAIVARDNAAEALSKATADAHARMLTAGVLGRIAAAAKAHLISGERWGL